MYMPENSNRKIYPSCFPERKELQISGKVNIAQVKIKPFLRFKFPKFETISNELKITKNKDIYLANLAIDQLFVN